MYLIDITFSDFTTTNDLQLILDSNKSKVTFNLLRHTTYLRFKYN